MIVTLYGLFAVGFMMAMYALEHLHRRFILAFALGCLLSSGYGFLSGAWPFGIVEAVWAVIALRRYRTGDDTPAPAPPGSALSPSPPGALWAGSGRPPAPGEAASDGPAPARTGTGRETPELSVWASTNPSPAGEPVTFRARISQSARGGRSATVTFGVGLSVLGTAPVGRDGVAVMTASGLPSGRHLVIVTTDNAAGQSLRTASFEHVVSDGDAAPSRTI